VSHKSYKASTHTDRAQLSLEMTFNVYDDNQGVEQISSFRYYSRIIDNTEWTHLEKAYSNVLEHKLVYTQDIYNDQSHQR
jgi:uncharacterized circularly permuted ATP-grasp superfamily protein